MSASAKPTQSYRTSCDRCRLQKLRCVPSSDGEWLNTCQRCSRARVPCVFSRRARSGRQPKKLDRTEEIPSTYSSESNASTPPLKSPGFLASQDDPLPSISRVDPIADPHNLADPSLDPILADMLFHTPGDQIVMPICMPFPVRKTEWWCSPESPSPELDLTKSSNSLDQTYYNQADTNHIREILNIPNTDSTMPDNPNSQVRIPSTQVQGLSLIPVAMTNYTSDLQRYRRANIDRKHSSSSIYDYPIGGATYLAQWLREIVSRQKWMRTGLPSFNPGSHDFVDTPTLLMMLSCYMSLLNIYDIVFHDLRQLFTILPDSTSSTSSRAGLRWDLRLGDLPLTNDGCVRILNAVQILLDALDAIEKDLEHIQSSNDNIIESMFGRNVGTGMVMEAGLSGGLRAKAEELQGLLKQILNL
ncbi:transcriptional regulator family: Fungal Specific TF [Penicillium roqueforti]|nr:transcriptional regulator family: Fungal Specific TF [Penicillium roqueforti]KAI2673595.1 transcriptional regulator family: Fungal Specific TF [Penicillium roqueforti]KAI3124271.1 transcriptional regulator family: Fungal Specific TF [Penicillium roqueforti]KAI3158873.1 transcriptional regulator family: Fungal Specific TF [Penicillium roqueforti]